MKKIDDLSISEGLIIEENMAYGTGNILVKIWFENKSNEFRIADFVQAFQTITEAKKATHFLKEIKGIAACYLVKKSPKYQLIEKIIKFTNSI